MKKIALLTIIFLSFLATNAQIGPITSICLATVDSSLTHNVVVWEKASQVSNIPIDSIKIYRTNLFGIDALVGVVPWSAISEFHDYSADPNLRAYRYSFKYKKG